MDPSEVICKDVDWIYLAQEASIGAKLYGGGEASIDFNITTCSIPNAEASLTVTLYIDDSRFPTYLQLCPYRRLLVNIAEYIDVFLCAYNTGYIDDTCL